MKRFIAVLAICGLCFTGCASFGVWSDSAKTEAAKIEADIKNLNWAAAEKYWQAFVNGLTVTAQLTKAVAGNVKINGMTIGTGIDTIVTPLLDKANDSVSALTTVAANLQAGTATVEDAQAALVQVKNDVVAANAVVGQIDKQAKSVQTAITAVPTK